MAVVFANFKQKAFSEFVTESSRFGHPLLIRLDDPITASTTCNREINFSGWFVQLVTNDTVLPEASAFEIRVELEELRLNTGGVFVGVGVCGYSFSSQQAEEPSNPLNNIFIKLKNSAWKDSESKLCGFQYEVAGRLNLGAFLPTEEMNSFEKRFRIRLSVNCEGAYAESNEAVIAIVSRDFATISRGGFLQAPAADYRASNLIISGWIAPGLSDECHTVAIKINSRVVSLAKIASLEGEVRKQLPILSNYNPIKFEAVIRRLELTQLGFKENDFLRPVKITAEAFLNSGHHVICEHFCILWNSSAANYRQVEEPECEIESVCRTSRGTVEISGWIRNCPHWDLQFALESRNARILFGDGGTIGAKCIMKDSKENWGTVGRDKFLLEFDPLFFGRFPGQLRLVAEDRVSRRRIEMTANISMIQEAAHAARGKLTLGENAFRSLVFAASSLGIRRDFSAIAKIEAEVDIQRAILSTTPQSIFFSTHNLSMCDGAAKILLAVIRKLRARIPELRITLVSPVPGPMMKILNQLKVKVFIVPELEASKFTCERFNSGISLVREIFVSRKIDFCFANVVDSFWAIHLSAALGVRSLWSVHESMAPENAFSEMDIRLRTAFLEAFSQANKLVFGSEASRKLYQRFLDGTDSKVIVNGVNIAEIDLIKSRVSKFSARTRLGIDSGEIVISIIGAVRHLKGQDIFLREMARLRKELPYCDLRFMIIGTEEGEQLEKLCHLAQKLGLEEVVEFVPRKPDISLYYLASDVICICSREEVAPLVSLEAFAYEVPVCTTKVCGPSEQVVDGKNALCFEPEVLGQLTDQVRRLVVDPELRAMLTATAKKMLTQRFAMDWTLNSYLKFANLL